MSYKINKTDGTLLVELTDGIIDITSTDITLVGRNYKGFGEAFTIKKVAVVHHQLGTTSPAITNFSKNHISDECPVTKLADKCSCNRPSDNYPINRPAH